MSIQTLAWIIAVCVLLTPAVVLILRPPLRRRRRRLLARPLPPPWSALLYGGCPLYRRIPSALRRRTEALARVFMDEVRFVGCAELEVTLEMRLLIAFQACLLIVEHGIHAYDALASVLIYPDEFVVDDAHQDASGVVTLLRRPLSGQTLDTARVVLSWADVRTSGVGDGYNVVLHEFAHHLDHTLHQGLSSPGPGSSWHDVLQTEYKALCDAVNRGEDTLIDPYGAEAPAEFFAVATEVFFELPAELRERHARLYDALARLYRLDPAGWARAS